MAGKVKGFCQIPTDVFIKMQTTDLTKTQIKVIAVIIRQTYGWRKKIDKIAFSVFANRSGINISNIARAVKNLVNRKIITKNSENNGYINNYHINTACSEWIERNETIVKNDNSSLSKTTRKPLSELTTPIVKIDNPPLSKLTRNPLSKLTNTKDNKYTSKRYYLNIPTFFDFVKKVLQNRFPPSFYQNMSKKKNKEKAEAERKSKIADLVSIYGESGAVAIVRRFYLYQKISEKRQYSYTFSKEYDKMIEKVHNFESKEAFRKLLRDLEGWNKESKKKEPAISSEISEGPERF